MITASKNRQNLFDSIFKLVFHIFHIKYDKKKSSNPCVVSSGLGLGVSFGFTLLLLILPLLGIRGRECAKVIIVIIMVLLCLHLSGFITLLGVKRFENEKKKFQKL